MSYFIDLETHQDNKGSLTVIEKVLPFEIKRVYYIYDVNTIRGYHRHKKTTQALIILNGSCEIFIDDGVSENTVLLNSPSKCLILEPKDWHTMDKFSKNSILLVLTSEYYDSKNYIKERY